MFSHFENQYRDMAFAPNKSRYARARCAGLAEEVLTAFLQGQERAYAVRMVTAELQALFHAGATLPVRFIEDALRCDDEDRQAGLMAEAMKMIWRQVRAEAAITGDPLA